MRFVRTNRYLRDLARIGATDSDMLALERAIALRPEAGDVIRGLGGIRKIRFRVGNRGKRGGGRAIYFLMIAEDTALMLTAYAKNEKSDLSAADRKMLMALIKELKDG